MGGVASAISDAFDAVGEVFDAVGDVVDSVVNIVGDVVDTIGTVVQAVINDPLPVLLSVAGSAVGIPPFVTMSALTAVRGGSLEDIALAGGTAFLGSAIGVGGVGDSISSTFSSTFIDAGINETFSTVAGDAITKGLVNGTITEIKGGEFIDGFAGGAIGGVVQAGVTDVGSYFKPDIINLATDNGIDLKDATSVYNATTRAVSAGVTSSITGKNDFATSFANSVVGSTINSGVNSVNSTIDQQFNSTVSFWNKVDDGKDPIDTTITGAGVPTTLVDQVQVSDIGVLTNTNTTKVASDEPIGDPKDDSLTPTGTVTVTGAPSGQTVSDFKDLLSTTGSTSGGDVLNGVTTTTLPSDVVDVFTTPITNTTTVADTTPVGGLTTVSDVLNPDTQVTTVNTETPVTNNLLTTGLPTDQPVGGLNTLAKNETSDDKLTTTQGFKPTDFTKPLVATVGNLLKSSFTQPKRPTSVKPAGGLQVASVKPKVSTPPTKVNVANLIPIQKAVPVKNPTTIAPPKTLASTAKLSPVSNIAGLTSMVKKVG